MKKIISNYIFILITLVIMYVLGILTYPKFTSYLNPLYISLVYIYAWIISLMNRDIVEQKVFYKVAIKTYFISFIVPFITLVLYFWIFYTISELKLSIKEIQTSFELSLTISLIKSQFSSIKDVKREKLQLRKLKEYSPAKVLKVTIATMLIISITIFVVQKILGYQVEDDKYLIGLVSIFSVIFLNVTKIKGARFD